MVNDIVDEARFGRFHWTIVALCGLLLIVDGYDVFIYGAILPQLMEHGTCPLRRPARSRAGRFSA